MKHEVDIAATTAIIENINSVERKLRMMKQLVNPQQGVITDIHLVTGLEIGSFECMNNISDLLLKFKLAAS